MSIPTRHLSLPGTHQSTQCQPQPQAAAPACLGTLLLCGSTDDQVWECCSLTFTMCVPAAGSVLAAKPQAGSGWFLLAPSGTPLLPPAHSFITTQQGKASLGAGNQQHPAQLLHEFQVSSNFLEGEQKQRFLTCVWRKGLEILTAA